MTFDLSHLPEELLVEILLKVDPEDIEAFSQTSKNWLHFVTRFQEVLFRYCKRFFPSPLLLLFFPLLFSSSSSLSSSLRLLSSFFLLSSPLLSFNPRRVYTVSYLGQTLELSLSPHHSLKDLQEKLLAQSGLDIPRQHLSFSGLEVKNLVRKRGIENPCKKDMIIQTRIRKALETGKILPGEYPPKETVAKLERYQRFLPSGTRLLLSNRNELLQLRELFGSGMAEVLIRDDDSLESFKERVAHNFGESQIGLVLHGGKVRSLDSLRSSKKIFTYRLMGGSPAKIGSLVPLPNAEGVALTTHVRFEFLLQLGIDSAGGLATQLITSLVNLRVIVRQVASFWNFFFHLLSSFFHSFSSCLSFPFSSQTPSGLPIEGVINRERVGDVITITFLPTHPLEPSGKYTVVATAEDPQEFGLHFFQIPLPHLAHQICAAQWHHQNTLIYHFKTT